VLILNDLLKSDSENVLFRRSILELALIRSEYNFDFMIELIKIYDEFGCASSFN